MKIVPPVRAERTYTQRLAAPPAEVFPLLCPVREVEWADGWEPRLVVTSSGLAEPDCAFVTPGSGGAPDAVWTITRHDPGAWFLEMVKVTPGHTVCRLTIGLRPDGDGCAAEVAYRHTSLGPAGDAFVAAFTPAYYETFMKAWEGELNAFLLRRRSSSAS